ncbi:hypothetical protein U0035_09830 [Niabella yanshanensis]|uniref:Lipoprotein n=1 Tax=Niabella yanshanensis TaxID=577386 RepID=A0ABZ0WAW0_9BACT|nr:hypothetical protein [Niabella yanshanensis]WQD40445.1 hypothetical protein U0035_09830 [Niabella yanshanensis]
MHLSVKCFFLLSFIYIIGCHATPSGEREIVTPDAPTATEPGYDTTQKNVHVLVALCDNKYQGIVPVPAKIGNGQDPDNNLYWGCGYGVRTYFKKSSHWTFIKSIKRDGIKMQRLVFKHKRKNSYLIADAYNGMYIKDCTVDFFQSCSGRLKDVLDINGKRIGINGNASLIAYIGHDGLMDFNLNESFQNTDGKKRDAIILACISKKYFTPYLSQTQARPLVWSTGLMSPEAYTLHDALNAYLSNQSPEAMRSAAAKAYAKYQKCSEKAARNLLVTGF